VKLFVQQILGNKVLTTAVTALVTAQVLKIFTNYMKIKKFDTERIVGAGGMPSSHTAFVVSLATAIGIQHGWDSDLFAIASILASIVMHDAAGVRRAAGKQARVINKLVTEKQSAHVAREGRLKELLGHTPIEVLAGALLGVSIAYALFRF